MSPVRGEKPDLTTALTTNNPEVPIQNPISLETSVLDNAYFRYSTGLDPEAGNTFVMPVPEGSVTFSPAKRCQSTHLGDGGDEGVDEDTGGGPYADGFQNSAVGDDEV
ncbi:hypothetical protein GLAREA_12556 [Glarea lozoyensis ATCC 20868]|uniref:Uncharacterized protein n=1 Tax=Glarea lozoyensis (strain ATCC 20868 / MF5171) TaxID=1116229 RepID=S3DY29_GLAL2|nr:uncharacterized protein GLAREA_12556 [Glarea lozoyensis ATCC 20868]EPE31253.1 hypothetical protein GLAREA_12556 [Glarea lozoyensis ATCC 20868]